MNKIKKKIICVFGLGYVGLQVSVALADKYQVIGYDNNAQRIKELKKNIDKTKEVSKKSLINSKIKFTDQDSEINEANVFIVAVPTPIDINKEPNLEALKVSSKIISKFLKKNDIVIYESTVYPGCTEEICIPMLESGSGLEIIKDFDVGYSPERVVPGDKDKTFKNISKIVSATSHKAVSQISKIYNSVLNKNVFISKSIKVAEAAKVIENTQRDVNIALINELAVIFDRIGIDTSSVIEAASTKWNFHKYSPGLVGGHCIGVDPYYLTSKAKKLGVYPDLIYEARKINESIPTYIVDKTIELIMKSKLSKTKPRVTILGFTFKENCPDTRNTKIIDLYNEFMKYNFNVDIYDPYAYEIDVKKEYNISLTKKKNLKKSDAVILAVSHQCFINKNKSYYINLCKKKGVFIDVKSNITDSELQKIRSDVKVWRL